MYEKFTLAKEKALRAWARFVPGFRRAWESYGYYISLALLLVMFGTVAYIYRTGKNETVAVNAAAMPTHEAQAAMAYHTPAVSPSPEPEEGFILPVTGEIIGAYSADELVWNETLEQWRTHPGIDIAAAEGTAVVACDSGVITDAYEDALYGYVVEISHDNEIISRYCALANLEFAEIGRSVKKGEIIGSVGAMPIIEAETGPHIHFEMLENGAYIEPVFE
jgi:murein DD-endopeptidase MepM/ murein hydrolase activator NlpD